MRVKSTIAWDYSNTFLNKDASQGDTWGSDTSLPGGKTLGACG